MQLQIVNLNVIILFILIVLLSGLNIKCKLKDLLSVRFVGILNLQSIWKS